MIKSLRYLLTSLYLNDITKTLLIMSNGKFEELPDGVQYIARLRLENPDVSLKELSELTVPPVSKSGVNHRLKKIHDIAEELR